MIPAAVEAIKQEVMKKLQLFGSVGKAPMSSAQIQSMIEQIVQETIKNRL